MARTPGAIERAARFLRRHRLVICMSLLNVAALAFGAVPDDYQSNPQIRPHPRDAAVTADAETSRREARRVVNRGAEAEMRKAIEDGEARVSDRAEDGEGSRTLATAYRRLGDLFVNTDRFSEAKWAYERAVELLRKRRQVEGGDDALSQKELADVFCSLGEATWALGQTHHAREIYREAVDIRRRLVAEHSDDSAFRDELAQTVDRLKRLSPEPARLAP